MTLATRIAFAFLFASGSIRAQDSLVLEAGKTWDLPVNTHRPEILDAEDRLLVVVVRPEGRPGTGQVKHRCYTLDRQDLSVEGEPFVVTRTTEELGEPADHRALLVNGELVVVYQSLVFGRTDEGVPREGPAEDRARSQSIVLARFSTDGKEILRRAIVANATDFRSDNFPDFCIHWTGGRLLVATGSRRRTIRIREVDLEANVLATHEVEASANGVSEDLGNSFLRTGKDLFLVSHTGPGGSRGITLTRLGDDLALGPTTVLGGSGGQPVFPTGACWDEGAGLGYVAYITAEEPGRLDLSQYPYGPRLLAIDRERRVVADVEVAGSGFSHVHPTVVQVGDRLLVAWSRPGRREGARNGPAPPQVSIREFRRVGK